MRYFSLFSGIGGFELGIERATKNHCPQSAAKKPQQTEPKIQQGGEWPPGKGGRDDVPDRHGELPSDRAWECAGYSEIDKYATQIYQKHFKEHKNHGDARRIVWGKAPDFDFLIAGFPCQSFSTAGKRGGFEDTRGTLFFEIARAAAAKRPQLLLLENVKGLLSHDNGRTFGTILATLSDLGYLLEWEVLNSKDFGVPQNRERVFIVGHLGGVRGQAVFPIRTQPQNNNEPDEKLQMPISNTLRTNYSNGYANETYTEEQMHIRRLTPTECERLQGFPDDWTKELSDTQRYKCLGNAVTVNVIEAIIERMICDNLARRFHK